MKTIKNKEVRRLFAELEKKNKEEKIKWWKSILPRKGSVLRALVENELKNNNEEDKSNA